MSALQDARMSISPGTDIMVLGRFFWDWYRMHSEDVILKKQILFFKVTIKVKDLTGLFTDLFGPRQY
jgi:hypothetical protein